MARSPETLGPRSSEAGSVRVIAGTDAWVKDLATEPTFASLVIAGSTVEAGGPPAKSTVTSSMHTAT